MRDMEEKYREYGEKAFNKLLHVQRTSLGDDHFEWLDKKESAITEKLNRIFRSGRTEKIWHNWSPRQRKIQLIRNAIDECQDEEVELDEFLPARKIYQATAEYTTEKAWEEAILSEINGSKSIGQILSQNVDHPSIERESGTAYNRWKISSSSENEKH